MATGAARDEAALLAGLSRWVETHADVVPGAVPDATEPPRVVSVTLAPGGMANETVLVDLGPGHRGMVVRLPPLEPTFPDYDLGPQAAVQNAVAAAGVPAPAPAVVVEDTAWVGAPFLAMPRVRGDIPGPAPLFDPYVRDATPGVQRAMHDALIETVAAVHAVDWHAHGVGSVLPTTGLAGAVERWQAYLAWSSEGDPLPALSAALAWCAGHLPPERTPVLLWGDVRLGNLVFDPARRVTAVLDWDLAWLGPPEADLGWHLGLEAMMEALFGARPPGFPPAREVCRLYEECTGHALVDLGWHEIFALTRALAINDRHQRITDDPRRRENPMGRVLLERLDAVAE
jgi:aminoglycoside phosphotransferase (APT) family kinase protein